MAAQSDNPLVNPIAKGTSMLDGSQKNQWYPTADRLQTPADHAAALKVVLDQQYTLQSRIEAMEANQGRGPEAIAQNGPANTKLLGLNVAPVDTQKLANGATLKWNSVSAQFEFV